MVRTITYSALKPFTCNIRICFTIVLFPDSPAPETERTTNKSQTMRVKKCLVMLVEVGFMNLNKLLGFVSLQRSWCHTLWKKGTKQDWEDTKLLMKKSWWPSGLLYTVLESRKADPPLYLKEEVLSFPILYTSVKTDTTGLAILNMSKLLPSIYPYVGDIPDSVS